MRGLYINPRALLLLVIILGVPGIARAQIFPPPPSFSPTFEVTYAWNDTSISHGSTHNFPEDGVGAGTYGWPGGLVLGALYKGELNNATEINGHLMGNASTLVSTQPNDYFQGSGKYFVTILRVSQHAFLNDPLHLYNEWFLHGTTLNPDARPPAEWGILEFEVKDGVVLYTQIESNFPSQALTSEWDDDVYAGGESGAYGCGGQEIPDISSCGCAVTSAVMVGRFHGALDGVDGNRIDPGTLNAWLKENGGYLDGGSVNWNSIAKYTGNKIKFTTHNSVPNNFALLDEKLNQNLPVIARAEYGRGDRSAHFFVIDKKLASTYRVKDPYWYNTKTLDEEATNHAAKIRDYLGGFDGLRVYEPHDGSPYAYVTFALGSPAELLITDVLGQRLGKDPTTGTVYGEIPGASYGSDDFGNPEEFGTLPAHEGKVAYIPDPGGAYTVSVIGTGEGGYSLTSIVSDTGGGVHESTLESEIHAGQIVTYHAAVDTTHADQSNVTLADATPPETQAVLSGEEGEVGWFHSAVTVNLFVTGEESDAYTEYRFGIGPWAPYAQPVVVSAEGAYSMQFRSRDSAGNQETEKSVSFTIDMTPPEARASLDVQTKKIKVETIDTYPQSATQTVNGQATTYTLTDKAHNTTILTLRAVQKPTFLTAFTAQTLSYNGSPMVLPENVAAYGWVAKQGKLQSFIEDVFIKGITNATGVYTAKTNSTQLIIIDLATKKKSTEKRQGLAILGIETSKGKLRTFTQ